MQGQIRHRFNKAAQVVEAGSYAQKGGLVSNQAACSCRCARQHTSCAFLGPAATPAHLTCRQESVGVHRLPLLQQVGFKGLPRHCQLACKTGKAGTQEGAGRDSGGEYAALHRQKQSAVQQRIHARSA
jgi:hypothetical protein